MENEIIAEVRKFRREKRKILHKKKRKGRVDRRTGRPGKRK
ncbi:MAG: hypothetical protein P8K09_02920 [Hyphomicrobiales bacterium]|jgi:hypothetical protein|nr:hypothetical protein [Hyphomicrobiales bacterium]|tara:strand:- start:295 stop:417 length:123 start_codon:yes stop_codon:yes gene_type:complete